MYAVDPETAIASTSGGIVPEKSGPLTTQDADMPSLPSAAAPANTTTQAATRQQSTTRATRGRENGAERNPLDLARNSPPGRCGLPPMHAVFPTEIPPTRNRTCAHC